MQMTWDDDTVWLVWPVWNKFEEAWTVCLTLYRLARKHDAKVLFFV